MTLHKTSHLVTLEYQLLKYLQKMDVHCAAQNYDKTLLNILVSGGKDSMSLLYALCSIISSKLFNSKTQFTLIVTHFNHKKRGHDSDEDALFVAAQCLKLGVEYFDSDIGTTKTNFQNFARQERKKLSTALCHKLQTSHDYDAFFMFTAHHMLDHVESVLFHLIRGSGLKGLQGFTNEAIEHTELKSGQFLKPFASVSADEISSYIKTKKIPFREDASNLTDNYARNRIRHHIVPKLKELNKNFDKNIFKLSTILSEFDTKFLKNHTYANNEFVFSSSTKAHHLYDYFMTQFAYTHDQNCENSEISANMIKNVLHELKLFQKSKSLEKTIPLKKNKTLLLKKKTNNTEQIFASIC